MAASEGPAERDDVASKFKVAMPDIDPEVLIRKLDELLEIENPVLVPEVAGLLEDLDKNQRAFLDNLHSLNGDEEKEKDFTDSIGEHRDGSPEFKRRLVPVDRVIAALHLYCANMTFHTMPEAWKDQVVSTVTGFAEQQIGRLALVKMVGARSFYALVINMFQGLISLPEIDRMLQIINQRIALEGQKMLIPFIVAEKQGAIELFTLPSVIAKPKEAVLRKPPSGGAPTVGLDGKVRGRPRRVRDVQTRHKFPVRERNYKKTHWF